MSNTDDLHIHMGQVHFAPQYQTGPAEKGFSQAAPVTYNIPSLPAPKTETPLLFILVAPDRKYTVVLQVHPGATLPVENSEATKAKWQEAFTHLGIPLENVHVIILENLDVHVLTA